VHFSDNLRYRILLDNPGEQSGIYLFSPVSPLIRIRIFFRYFVIRFLRALFPAQKPAIREQEVGRVRAWSVVIGRSDSNGVLFLHQKNRGAGSLGPAGFFDLQNPRKYYVEETFGFLLLPEVLMNLSEFANI
jgi:hypothetical protein